LEFWDRKADVAIVKAEMIRCRIAESSGMFAGFFLR
jgi:hypothetical protein